MDDPLPVGMGLRVPQPDSNKIPPAPHSYFPGMAVLPGMPAQVLPQPTVPVQQKQFTPGPDGLGDFDDLTVSQVRFQLFRSGGSF